MMRPNLESASCITIQYIPESTALMFCSTTGGRRRFVESNDHDDQAIIFLAWGPHGKTIYKFLISKQTPFPFFLFLFFHLDNPLLYFLSLYRGHTGLVLWSPLTPSSAVNGPHENFKRLSSTTFGLNACFSRSWPPVRVSVLCSIWANNWNCHSGRSGEPAD